jgi:hypothetical protein
MTSPRCQLASVDIPRETGQVADEKVMIIQFSAFWQETLDAKNHLRKSVRESLQQQEKKRNTQKISHHSLGREDQGTGRRRKGI